MAAVTIRRRCADGPLTRRTLQTTQNFRWTTRCFGLVMRWTLSLILLALLPLANGCIVGDDDDDDDPDDEEVIEVTSELGGAPRPIVVGVPKSSSAQSFVRRLRFTFPKALHPGCGTGFTVRMKVRLGAVTSSSVRVNAITATFLPANDEWVMPTYVDVWSNTTANSRLIDSSYQKGFRRGQSHTWTVRKTLGVHARGANDVNPATINMPLGGGLRSGDLGEDLACTLPSTVQILPR